MKYAFKWDPTQFEDNKQLQKYEEIWIDFLSQVQHSQATCEPKDIHDSAHQSR